MQEDGFSLVEVSVAMGLWGLLILGTVGILYQTLASEEVQRESISQQIAQKHLNEMIATQYVGEKVIGDSGFQVKLKAVSYTQKWVYETSVYQKSILYYQLKSVQYRPPNPVR